MSRRFLADMGVSARVVAWLREKGHDVAHLAELGLQRISDDEIFQRARAESRIVLTFDLDFGEILAGAHGEFTSVVLFRVQNATSSFVIRRLESVLHESADALDRGAIIVVEDARHRIRTLPL